MNRRLFQLLVVNLGVAIVYAFQRRIAMKIVGAVDDAILRGRWEKEHRYQRRPYPMPRHKNLYYREE